MSSEQEAGAPAAAPEAPQTPAPAATAEAPAASGKPAQDTAQSASAPEANGEKTGEQPKTDQDPENKRGSRRFERRLDRAYRRAAEAEAKAQLFEKQLTEFRQQHAPAPDPKAPRLDQFDDIEKYAKAKADYEAEKRLSEHTTKQREAAQKQQREALVGEWEDRVSKAEDKYEDFAEVVGEISPDTPLGTAIMSVENGEDVAYHLGKNLKEAEAIAKLPPIAQVLAIGRLSQKLAAQPATPPKPSKAPAPVNPLNGTTTPSGEPDSKKDYGAWLKWRNQQLYGNARAR